MYICVSGNLGSGKTTLAKNLGALLGWQVVPTSSYDGSYLIDLFSNPSRWAFEAQSAFLLHKFRHIANALKHERPFIVDRSMSEDVHVFCKYFHVNNLMEARSYELLSNLYQILAPQIELPAITIFCQSSAEVCQERALKRKREYQNLYPADHFAQLGDIYADRVKAQSHYPAVGG